MKVLKYQIESGTGNRGTEENPIVEPILLPKERFSDDVNFERNLAIAKAEAYNGEVTVEEVADEEFEPTKTPEQRLTDVETDVGELNEALELILSGVTE